MDNSYKDKIQLFIQGQLSASEAKKIRTKMEQDPTFKKKVELEILAQKGIEKAARDRWKKKFEAWDKEIEVSTATPIRPIYGVLRSGWAVAATIVVLIITGTILLRPANFVDPEEWVQNRLQQRDTINLQVAGTIEQEKRLAELAFNQGNYFQSIEHFNNIITQDSLGEILLFKAKALRYEGKEAEAISVLQNLIDHPKGWLGEIPQLELAITYLQQEKYGLSRKSLEPILGLPNSKQYAEAKQMDKLLKKLEKKKSKK